ncbi:unnamed protein product [Vitrella brassicaformis CCMP3155]|uniref:EF-hand domain-containing protein n=1 Tax=Vitrella brassicaformis (strain CCMP3155) TaxID=1169540 RepID=A0A0G4ENF4_VITBC|nr:unnamed protein product [Vitrella brassicaformis CCMP3155]|eukprot:CEL98532.1 unnamed protein product [Vitrella brassicaformis CCMP3155]
MKRQTNLHGSGSWRRMDAKDLNRVEEELLSRLVQRAANPAAPAAFVGKLFKYHDLGDTGRCDFARFKKSLEPYAGHLPDHVMQQIFSRYAGGDVSAAMPYRDFAVAFCSGKVRGSDELAQTGKIATLQGPGGPSVGEAKLDTASIPAADQLVQRMKDYIADTDPYALVRFALEFTDHDVANSRMISLQDLMVVLRRGTVARLEIDSDDTKLLFTRFRAPHHSGSFAYDLLIAELKAALSKAVWDVVREAFRRLTEMVEGEKVVPMDDIIRLYNAARHPQVAANRQEGVEQRALKDFVESLQGVLNYRRGTGSAARNVNKTVTWEEFIAYNEFIAGYYYKHGDMIELVTRVWDLDKPAIAFDSALKVDPAAGPAAGTQARQRVDLHHWHQDTMHETVEYRAPTSAIDLAETFQRIRANIASRGLLAAVEVVQAFIEADDDHDDHIDMGEFRRACVQCGLHASPSEEAALFADTSIAKHTHTVAGKPIALVPVTKLLAVLWGPIKPARRVMVECAFHALDRDEMGGRAGGQIPLSVIKHNFQAGAHPLVDQGRAEAELIAKEFETSITKFIAAVHGGDRVCGVDDADVMVTGADWIQYYSVVSALVDDQNDAYFNTMVSRCWGLVDPDLDLAEAAKEEEDDALRPPTAREPPNPPRKPEEHIYDRQLFKDDNQYYAKPHPFLYDTTPPTGKTLPKDYPQPPYHPGPQPRNIDVPPSPRSYGRFLRLPVLEGAPDARQSPTTKSFLTFAFGDVFSNNLELICRRLRGRLAQTRLLQPWKNLLAAVDKYDGFGKQVLTKSDWHRLCRVMSLGLTPVERDIIFSAFDADMDGHFHYGPFFDMLQGGMSTRRMEWTQKAWQAATGSPAPSAEGWADSNEQQGGGEGGGGGEGANVAITLEDLLGKMNFAAHPAFVLAHVPIEKVREDFKSICEHFSLNPPPPPPDLSTSRGSWTAAALQKQEPSGRRTARPKPNLDWPAFLATFAIASAVYIKSDEYRLLTYGCFDIPMTMPPYDGQIPDKDAVAVEVTAKVDQGAEEAGQQQQQQQQQQPLMADELDATQMPPAVAEEEGKVEGMGETGQMLSEALGGEGGKRARVVPPIENMPEGGGAAYN